ncbi:hypothetical protein D3C84_508090 [compost metagenome]
MQVDAHHVEHTERPHGETEALQRCVHLVGISAFQQHFSRFEHIGIEHAVADETVAIARHHTDLAHALAERQCRVEHRRCSLRATDDFQQFHDMRRAEEVQAQHLLRPTCDRGDGIDVQCRSIAGQNRLRFEQAIELAENFLLELKVFVHRFDDQVDIADGRITLCRRNARDTGIGFALINTPLTHVVGVGVRYGGQRLLQHLRIVVDPLHGHSGVGQAHDNATAHGARADDGGALNIRRCLAHVLFSCWRSEDSHHHSQPPAFFEIYSCDEQHSADGCSPLSTPQIPVGAGLLAKAIHLLAVMVTDPPLSRASPLPH